MILTFNSANVVDYESFNDNASCEIFWSIFFQKPKINYLFIFY